MTNIDHTAEHLDSLDRLYYYASGQKPTNVERAQALADTGYLMPDLPEPDGFCNWDMDPLVVRIDTATRKVCLEYLDPYEGEQIYMFSDEAREVAYALLAAAEHAERNQE